MQPCGQPSLGCGVPRISRLRSEAESMNMLIPPFEIARIVETKSIVREAARGAFGQVLGVPICDGGRVVGTRYECADATYCYLEEIVPRDAHASGADQTRDVFEAIARVLRAEGMAFTDLVRTWFYLDKILDWYDEFNQARTPFLQQHGVFEHRVPASTGIGMPNRFGSAVLAGALAIKPKGAQIVEVPSPMQGSALDYKSSFSRAVEVTRAGQRELYISGTASIEPGGQTAHLDNPVAQIELTMEVVEAILHSRRMGWSHCTRAIAYLKEVGDCRMFYQYLSSHGLEDLPLTVMHGDICRSDLLFELELEAVDLHAS